MAKQVSCILPKENAEFKITTGCDKGSSVYIFGLPNSEGFRDIQCNDEKSFLGTIVGPVLDPNNETITEENVMTKFDDGRVLVCKCMLRVGEPMGIWTNSESKNPIVSRSIISIEIF